MAGAALAALAIARSLRPVQLRRGSRLDLVLLFAEVVVAVAAAVGTGGWTSPYLFSLAVSGVAIGYGFGLAAAAGAGAAIVGSVTVLAEAVGTGAPDRDAVLGGTQVLLVLLVAGYARRLFVEQVARVDQAVSRADRLTEANDLLFELYRVAQALPVSLDLGDTLASTLARLRELLEADAVVVLLPDDGAPTWSAAVAEGVRATGPRRLDELPAPLRRAATEPVPHLEAELPASGGVAFASRSGIYAALRARGQLVGLLAVERRSPGSFAERDARLLEGLADQAAVAIDNARIFRRLRTVGADEERNRIARELHDRVGQSLAYLAFELDRTAARAEGPLQAELAGLRDDARRAVSEVREALYDLRTEVTEVAGLAPVLAAHVERVRARSGLQVVLRVEDGRRPPLTHERELLRIAQEALTNVERHAGARSVAVTLALRPDEVVLEVVDDGTGYDTAQAGRPGSFGLLGMRERADAIGAVLDVSSTPGRGTAVRCLLRQADLQGAPS